VIISNVRAISFVLERSRIAEVLVTILSASELNETNILELDVRVLLGWLKG
jgi:hypothetical protein